MAANGVSENDRKEYEEYLGVKDVESLNDLCRVLIYRLPKADNTSRFSVANSVWVNSGMGIKLNKEYSMPRVLSLINSMAWAVALR